MALLSKEKILSANDRPTEDVEVPEWGGTVRVRGLSGAERDAFESSLLGPDGKPSPSRLANFRARLLARTLVDETGNRLFSDSEIKALGEKSGEVLSRLFDVAQRLSGMTRRDVDVYVGNSDGGQNGGSISA